MTPDLQAELASYVRASYPFLALQTHEEDRALALLGAIAEQLGVALIPVSFTAARRADGEATALSCLEQLGASGDAAIFALIDFHPWLSDAVVCRVLRDLRGPLEQRGQTAVFVSPAIRVPHDLEADVVVFDLPLPDPSELGRLLAGECRRAQVEIDLAVASKAIRAVQGLTALGAGRAFRRAIADPAGLVAGDVATLVEEKRRLLRRTDLLEFVDTPPGLDQIGGLDTLKQWLVEREAAFDQRARAFGLPTPKGLLLVGVQGCGKSLTAKAVARLWDLPLARLDFGALFTFGHSPEQNLRRVFRVSEALAPVVLWVDEIDKAFQSVGSDSAASEVLSRVFATFITWMQEKTSSVFVAATANSVDHLPAELLRKGRFDEIFFVDLPSRDERAHILAIHLEAHRRPAKGYDVGALADASEHLSGAELEQAIIAGLYRAFQHGRELIDEDVLVAIKGTVPLYRTAEEQIKGLREWAATRARRASPDARITGFWGGSRS